MDCFRQRIEKLESEAVISQARIRQLGLMNSQYQSRLQQLDNLRKTMVETLKTLDTSTEYTLPTETTPSATRRRARPRSDARRGQPIVTIEDTVE